jgi:hypothetical protein
MHLLRVLFHSDCASQIVCIVIALSLFLIVTPEVSYKIQGFQVLAFMISKFVFCVGATYLFLKPLLRTAALRMRTESTVSLMIQLMDDSSPVELLPSKQKIGLRHTLTGCVVAVLSSVVAYTLYSYLLVFGLEWDNPFNPWAVLCADFVVNDFGMFLSSGLFYATILKIQRSLGISCLSLSLTSSSTAHSEGRLVDSTQTEPSNTYDTISGQSDPMSHSGPLYVSISLDDR